MSLVHIIHYAVSKAQLFKQAQSINLFNSSTDVKQRREPQTSTRRRCATTLACNKAPHSKPILQDEDALKLPEPAPTYSTNQGVLNNANTKKLHKPSTTDSTLQIYPQETSHLEQGDAVSEFLGNLENSFPISV
jgi:hypothetical protein